MTPDNFTFGGALLWLLVFVFRFFLAWLVFSLITIFGILGWIAWRRPRGPL
jgi:cobalamin biosynthesis protein CobD/CbiB